MKREDLLKFYKTLLNVGRTTFIGAVECGFDIKTAYTVIRDLVLCGALSESERGVFEIAAGDKLALYMHSKDVWIEDGEEYLSLKKQARGFSANQLSILDKCLQNDGKIESITSEDEIVAAQELIEQGVLRRVDNDIYSNDIDLYTVKKLLEFADEKKKEFVSYIIGKAQEVLAFKLRAEARKKEFEEHSKLYGVFTGLKIDPLDFKEEELFELSQEERESFLKFADIFKTIIAPRNAMKSNAVSDCRYPDDENGSSDISDTVFISAVDRILKIIDGIKGRRN